MFPMLLYYITFCHGLSPFKFNYTSSCRIVESKFCTSFTVIAGLFFCCITVYTQCHTLLTWRPDRPKLVLLLVAALESLVLTVQNVSVFAIQNGNRKELVKFLNEGLELATQLKKISPDDMIFSAKFRKCLRSKLMSKCLQVIWLIVNTMSFCVRENRIGEWFFGLASITIYTYAMVISSLYYCGSILISARFYEILNAKIVKLASSINEKYNLKPSDQEIQLSCDASNEIDCIAVLYDRIVSFVELIDKLFSTQIVLIKLSSFVLAISSTFIFYCTLLAYLDHNSKKYTVIFLVFEFFFTVGFSAVQVAEIFYIGITSSVMLNEAQRTLILINKCGCSRNDNRLKSSIALFSIQMSQRRPVLWGSKMFTINKATIFSFMATIASYLIILIQFELADTSTNYKKYKPLLGNWPEKTRSGA